jgi:hypothetical protein
MLLELACGSTTPGCWKNVFRTSIYISKISIDAYYVLAGVALEDPKTEDLSQEVRGFIFSKILVRSVQS